MDDIVTVTLNTAVDRLIEVPDFHVGGHVPGRHLARIPAGKGVNVSRALAILGVPSVATGFVGREQLEDFERSLRPSAGRGADAAGAGDPHATANEHANAATTRDGGPATTRHADTASTIQPQFLAIDGVTRENITIIDPTACNETHVRDVGAAPTHDDLARLEQKLNLLAHEGTLVIIAGGLPPDVPTDYAVGLIDMLLAKRARVALDASGPLLAAARQRRLWLVKPNAWELAAMWEARPKHDPAPAPGATSGPEPGSDTPAPGANAPARAANASPPISDTRGSAWTARQIVAAGCDLSRRSHVVMVSQGSAGGYVFSDGTAVAGRVAVDPGLVRSTVGCGDCMLAAFVAARRRGDDVRASFRYALAVASAAALDVMPGTFDPNAIPAMLERTSVGPI